ncbi:MAG TPA: biopolymer transporter ExbD [Verrucomicrobiota bacterium]|nr:biopolymer transporter ExbD [Verrucomicrobiota bacterium]HRZ34862.1 biopolymer transporter ExbD [Candidatus Paceibacterota bacterium]HRZ55841.1 biopolymer transporter ExbD [Candidatus Paceibacterota bacterium]
MPVQLGSRLPPEHAEARIEIIPLIDIMFFLLAAFMLVSLSMVNLKSVKVSLPTATLAASEAGDGIVQISIDKAGLVFLDRSPIGHHELAAALASRRATNAAVRVLLSGDAEARHGDIIRVLDWIRAAGIDKVAFQVRTPAPTAAP